MGTIVRKMVLSNFDRTTNLGGKTQNTELKTSGSCSKETMAHRYTILLLLT